MPYLYAVSTGKGVVDSVVLLVDIFHHSAEPGELVDAFIDFWVRAIVLRSLNYILLYHKEFKLLISSEFVKL